MTDPVTGLPVEAIRFGSTTESARAISAWLKESDPSVTVRLEIQPTTTNGDFILQHEVIPVFAEVYGAEQKQAAWSLSRRWPLSSRKKYRPRHSPVEAIQIKLNTWSEIVEWVQGAHGVYLDLSDETITFETPYGLVTAGYNWWVVKNGKRFYPVSPKQFRKKYEEIDDEPVL